MTANEEFAAEVTRLYEEEEKLSREHADTKQHLETNISDLKQKLEEDRDDWETQRRKMEEQEQRLMESIKMLSQDNMRLITEREEETINQSKTHQVMITHNHNTAGLIEMCTLLLEINDLNFFYSFALKATPLNLLLPVKQDSV